MDVNKPLPCKKCISYAMCIHRKRISCNKLLDIINKYRQKINWFEINEILPKVNSIQYEVISDRPLLRVAYVNGQNYLEGKKETE